MDRMTAFKKISELRDFAEILEKNFREAVPDIGSFTFLEVVVVNDFSGDKITIELNAELLNHCANAMEETLLNGDTTKIPPYSENG